jgi:hypothetical protein
MQWVKYVGKRDCNGRVCRAEHGKVHRHVHEQRIRQPLLQHHVSNLHVQQQSKVCIQTFALLYSFCCTLQHSAVILLHFAVHCSIPLHPQLPWYHESAELTQLITGDYVIKFERNSFRVQLSARGIAICFASAQPKAEVSGVVDCLCLCLPSKSKSQIATTLANF